MHHTTPSRSPHNALHSPSYNDVIQEALFGAGAGQLCLPGRLALEMYAEFLTRGKLSC